MGYQFSFTKIRLLVLIVMSLLAALLIFAGGVATGRHMTGVTEMQLNKQLVLAKPGLKVPALPAVAPVTALAAVTAPVVAAVPAPAATPTPAPETAPAVAPAPAPVAAVAVAVANPADQPFVLQVGAFRETKGAKDLQTDLQKKGYATTIYNMVDQDQRSWHMVRFGGYKDVSTASKAASDFTGKEGIQALVKRFDSL
jgi:cell division septation protein DedD